MPLLNTNRKKEDLKVGVTVITKAVIYKVFIPKYRCSV